MNMIAYSRNTENTEETQSTLRFFSVFSVHPVLLLFIVARPKLPVGHTYIFHVSRSHFLHICVQSCIHWAASCMAQRYSLF